MAWKRNKWGPRKKNEYLPFKNKFEQDIAKVLEHCDYEDKKRVVAYETKAKYNPDFTNENIPWLLIEAKGRFMGGSKEAAKYVWVKRCHPKMEFIFLFSNQNNRAYPGCRRRKDGSYLTMGEWAAKQGFLSFNAKHLPMWLRNGAPFTKEFFYVRLNEQRETYGFKPIQGDIV